MSAMEVPYEWPVGLHPDARPVPRSEHEVDVVLGEGAIRIQSVQAGLPAVLNRLLRERPLGAVVASGEAAGFTPADTARLLAQLGAAGQLRRLAEPGLSAEELRDFERELGALARHERDDASRFELFQRVRRAHVLVVGCGLTGASVVQHLAASGVGSLSLVDPAVVGPSQAGRHPWFFRRDVGQPKAEVLRDRVLEATPHTTARALTQGVEDEAHLAAILDSVPQVDLLIYTLDVDNLAFGIWAARQARARGIGLLRVNRIVVGPLTRPGHADACPACVLPRLQRGVQALPTVLSLCGVERDETAYLWSPELSAFGALAADEALRYLSGVGGFETLGVQVAPGPGGGARQTKPFPRDPECPVCGEGAGC